MLEEDLQILIDQTDIPRDLAKKLLIHKKGDLVESIHQFVGGSRSGMGYCGCKTIDDLKENGKFVQITGAGLQESHPHNVMITKESPNYSR